MTLVTCHLNIHLYLTVANETSETRIVTLIILVRLDGVPMAATKLPVRALHALRVLTRELLDQDVDDGVDHRISTLPLPQLLQEPQVDVDQISQSRKHTLEVRLTQTKVTSQTLCEDPLHGEQHQAVMLLRQYKFVYVLLPLHFALAMIDETQRDVTPDGGAPGVRFLLAQSQLGIDLFELSHGELVIISEIEFLPSAETR